eukprot:jgi/Hompol1/1842/HPOL_005744-RA
MTSLVDAQLHNAFELLAIEETLEICKQIYIIDEKRISTSVKGAILRFCGSSCRHHSSLLKQQQRMEVLSLLLEPLEELVPTEKKIRMLQSIESFRSIDESYSTSVLRQGRKIEMAHIAGALAGLNSFIISNQDLVPLVGIQLIIDNASAFRPFLLKDTVVVYDSLEQMCKHINRGISSLAMSAMQSFMTAELKKRIAAPLSNPNSLTIRDITMSVVGVGILSKAYTPLITANTPRHSFDGHSVAYESQTQIKHEMDKMILLTHKFFTE